MKKNRLKSRTILNIAIIIVSLSAIVWVLSDSSITEKLGKSADQAGEFPEAVGTSSDQLDQMLTEEKSELQAEFDSVVNEFNTQLTQFEQRLENKAEEVDFLSQQVIDDLKAERDTLSSELEEFQAQSLEKWNEFEEEYRHDLGKFVESIEYFFEDNA